MSLLILVSLLQVSLFVVLARWAMSIRAAQAELDARKGATSAAPTAIEATVLADAEQTAQIGSYGIDLSTGHIGCSEELRRLFDLPPDHHLTSSDELLACVHPADREAVGQAWEEAKRVGRPVTIEHRIVRPDGSSRWVDGRVRALSDGGDRPARLIGTMHDVSARRAVESALAHQALHDSLTGLPNRASFLGRLSQVMAQRQVRPSGLAVFFLDLDRFKWLNDSRGHAAGDELLVKMARRLKATMRPGDTVSRFGGDEFVVLCEDVPTEQEAVNLADRVAAVLRQPVEVAGEELAVTVSIGIAYLDADDVTVTSEALVRDADAAMYEAKERGRDRHEIFDASTRLAAATRQELVAALRRGVAESQFVVHYQPTLDLVTRRLVGFEALVRWDRPGRGLLGPDAFLNVAEETGLMIPIGGQVLSAACRQMVAWQEALRQAGGGTGTDLTVSVNLVRRQLLDSSLSDVVERVLVETGLLPHQLQVEITESILLSDADASSRAIERLRKLGISIAVDDFGSCFSSLSFLRQFPVDVLKIDKAFVKGLGKEREDRSIVAGVVDLAHAFGLSTVAEGVETLEQLDELRAVGCELGQGYLWSRPLPADEAEAWLRQHEAPAVVAVTRPGAATVSGEQAVEPGHRVLVVDDDRTYRQMLRLIVESGTSYRVVGEAGDGREAIALARTLCPDVILLDLAMPGMGGLEALPHLLAEVPDARVVVLSSLEPAYLLEQAGGSGVAAFCTKTDAPDTLLDALGPAVAA